MNVVGVFALINIIFGNMKFNRTQNVLINTKYIEMIV